MESCQKKNPTQSIFFSANYILQNLPRNLQISLRDLQFLFFEFKNPFHSELANFDEFRNI